MFIDSRNDAYKNISEEERRENGKFRQRQRNEMSEGNFVVVMRRTISFRHPLSPRFAPFKPPRYIQLLNHYASTSDT